MGRILFWLAIGFGLVMLARVLAGKRSVSVKRTDKKSESAAQNTEKPKSDKAVELLPCPQCSMHLPESALAEHVAQHTASR